MKKLFIILLIVTVFSCFSCGGILHYQKFDFYRPINYNKQDTLDLYIPGKIKLHLTNLFSCRWKFRYYVAFSFFVQNTNDSDTIYFDIKNVAIKAGGELLTLKPSYTMVDEKGKELMFKTNRLHDRYSIPPKFGITIPFQFESKKKYSQLEYRRTFENDTIYISLYGNDHKYNVQYELIGLQN